MVYTSKILKRMAVAKSLASPKTHTPLPQVEKRGLRFYQPGAGRWVNKDPIEEGGGLNQYAFTHNYPVNAVDLLGLIRYELDKNLCELKVEMTWKLSFLGARDFRTLWIKRAQWPADEVEKWKKAADAAVHNYFSNLKFKCYPVNPKCCVCEKGVSVRVDVRFVETDPADYDVEVGWRSHRSSTATEPGMVYSSGSFDRFDVVPNKKGRTTIVHEAGHMFGLHHPGQDLIPPAELNSDEDYDADPDSIMGSGIDLRLKDFQRAFCNHVTATEKDCERWYGQ